MTCCERFNNICDKAREVLSERDTANFYAYALGLTSHSWTRQQLDLLEYNLKRGYKWAESKSKE